MTGTYSRGRPELLGALTRHPVVLGGREVPHLEAWTEPGTPDKVWISMPGRMLDIPAGEADRIIEFIADAIAVAMGYTCHPSADMEPVRQTPFPIVHMITSVTTDADVLAALDPDKEDG